MSDLQKPKLPTTLAIGDRPALANVPSLGNQTMDTESVVGLFRSIPLFSSLNASEVTEVLRMCTIETYAAGDVLFQEDEAADAMYIIERGEVAVTRRSGKEDVRVAYVGDGSVVGEMALIVSSPRSASVKAISETRVYRLEGRDLEALRHQRSVAAHKILYKLLEILGDRRHSVTQRVGEIFAHPENHIPSFEKMTREMMSELQKIQPKHAE